MTKSYSPSVGHSTPPPSCTNPLTKGQTPPSIFLSHSPLLSVAGCSSPRPLTDDEEFNFPSIPSPKPPSPLDFVETTSPKALGSAPTIPPSRKSIDKPQLILSPSPHSPRNISRILRLSPLLEFVPCRLSKSLPRPLPVHQLSFAIAQEQLLRTQ